MTLATGIILFLAFGICAASISVNVFDNYHNERFKAFRRSRIIFIILTLCVLATSYIAFAWQTTVMLSLISAKAIFKTFIPKKVLRKEATSLLPENITGIIIKKITYSAKAPIPTSVITETEKTSEKAWETYKAKNEEDFWATYQEAVAQIKNL